MCVNNPSLILIQPARDSDMRGYRNAESAARDLTRNIRREVTKLSEIWVSLLNRSDVWQHRLEETVSVGSLIIILEIILYL